MAEAVGIYVGLAASINTLLQLSKEVVEYIGNTSGASKQKEELVKEITATASLLNDLEKRVKSDKWRHKIDSLEGFDRPLELFRTVLTTLESKIKSSRNSFISISKRIIWHFEKGEYETILSKIERSKSSLSIALQL